MVKPKPKKKGRAKAQFSSQLQTLEEMGFTTDLGLKVQVGWHDLDDRLQLQSRVRWTYLPGSDLFLVYQLDLDTDAGQPAFQSLQLKATFRYPWE